MKNDSNQLGVQYGKTTIRYLLNHTDRKNLAIHVHPDLNVEVEAPLGSELEEIKDKVLKRAGWILKQQRLFERYSFELPPREYVSGETHRYLGRQYRLKVIVKESGGGTVKMERGRILIHTSDPGNQDKKKILLEDWYRKQAWRVFAERLEKWLPHFERFGKNQPSLMIRKMKSQWGSCTPEGKITLNLKLIQLPKHLIDYLIVHELSHLVELNHSGEFYSLLARVMPDWEERKEKLNRFEF